ncbi:hypothetical protein [Streptomyces sp. NPDC091209]|uniref:hypothetical protein n=1 Tax=Streptomyces sp. NPDC091209 TaxID=3365974 RepID=UPI003805C4BE
MVVARRESGVRAAGHDVTWSRRPDTDEHSRRPVALRLDALLAAGREGEARECFAKTVESDKDSSTDASDRLAELDGVEFVDALVEDDREDDAPHRPQS